MTTKSTMTDVSAQEMQETTGGVNFATIQFLQRTSNLTRMQVSALKYHNRQEDPARYQGVLPPTDHDMAIGMQPLS